MAVKLSTLSRIKTFLISPAGHISLILVGIFLRIQQYLFNRSLWLDEVALAQNIIGHSYADLLKPLESDQLAPFGFLWVSKFFVTLIGPSEFGLRFFPLLCGILSIVFFYLICRQCLDLKATTYALVLFVLQGQFIYFSSEVKPYICDVFAALVITYLTLKIIDQKRSNIFYYILWALVGSAAIWVSYPVIMVLAASIVVLTTFSDKKKMGLLGVACILPAFNFYKFYALTKQNFVQSADYFHNYWQDYFVPLIPKTPWELQTLIGHLLDVFKDPGGFYFKSLALVLFIVGGWSLYQNNRKVFSLVVLPTVFTLIASFLKKYPFAERLILFLVPSYIILVASGLACVRDKAKQLPVLGSLMLILLFLHPILSSAYHVIKPRTREELKLVLKYFNEHIQPGDRLFIEYYGYKSLMYYVDQCPRCSQIPIKSWIIGDKNQDPERSLENIESLKDKKRVWVLFPHLRYEGDDGLQDALFFKYLSHRGKLLQSSEISGMRYMFYENKTVGSAVFLYDLSNQGEI
jgi:uncharacterized membrane protein